METIAIDRTVPELTAEPFAATMRRLAPRYLGPGGDDLYPDTVTGVVVRIVPGRIRCWDFADDMAALQGTDG